jgi:hypothetical protein
MAKTIVFFGNTASTITNTLSEPSVSSTTGAPTWSSAKSEFRSMDVLLNIKTLTGTSPTWTVSVQERFSDVGFVETGKSAALSSTGKYILANDGQTGATNTTNILYGFSMQGKGTDKQIVFTAGGTVGTSSIDVYLIFFK